MALRDMDLIKPYKNCRLCPRRCGVDRCNDATCFGFCGESHRLRTAYVGAHFGEEPPITGKNGSGTVFFSGCSLKCSFCQNYQISHHNMGEEDSLEGLLAKLIRMIQADHVHNINFITPDHFFPHIFCLVSLLRDKGFDIPIIYNLSGYQSIDMLRATADYADIYLPDFKYSDPSLAASLSKCRDYPQVALEAITEMVRQKGFLDICSTDSALAKKGVLVRHLILPGNIQNSIDALTGLFVEFGPELPVSLMSQYHPVFSHKDPDLNRFVSEKEFDRVYFHAMELGFERLFVQFPEKQKDLDPSASPFLPDFAGKEPFRPLP